MLQKDSKILIIGLGLIGGSYAQGLKKAGYEVGAITRSPETIAYALREGLIDSGATEVTADYVARFDLLVFALYPHVLLDWIGRWQSCIKPDALLTDVTGVKGALVYRIQEMLRPDLEFIGAHPMAGREVSGVQNADCRIFQGANYIVTPTEANSPEAVSACEELGRILGFGRISRLSPEEHDEMIGFLSQLTHCIAVSLMNCKESRHLVDFTGDSFRDLTRIARINDEMWPELFALNKRELVSQMDLFEGEFRRLRDAIERDDGDTVREMMRTSTLRRSYFDKKND